MFHITYLFIQKDLFGLKTIAQQVFTLSAVRLAVSGWNDIGLLGDRNWFVYRLTQKALLFTCGVSQQPTQTCLRTGF
jgi:hypothetical protein